MPDELIIERWLPVVRYEGYYEVSDQGRVRSVERTIRNRLYKEQILSQKTRKYQWVNLKKNAQQHMRTVHSLVLEAFIGPCPEGQECRHLNGIKSDNRLENLCWGTPKENKADDVRNGTHLRYDVCPKCGGLMTRSPNDTGRRCKQCMNERKRKRWAEKKAKSSDLFDPLPSTATLPTC